MKRDKDLREYEDIESESGATVDALGDKADTLASESDDAFARGRRYAKYSLGSARRSIGNHPKDYVRQFMAGYRWQQRRLK